MPLQGKVHQTAIEPGPGYPRRRPLRQEREVTIPMSTGTTHMNGLMAGAARLGTCGASHHVVAPISAYAQNQKWLDARTIESVSPVFGTHRPDPRPPERSP